MNLCYEDKANMHLDLMCALIFILFFVKMIHNKINDILGQSQGQILKKLLTHPYISGYDIDDKKGWIAKTIEANWSGLPINQKR